LQNMPYERLNNASKKAIAKVSAELKAEGKPADRFGLGWNSVLDGYLLPNQPTDREAKELSKNIPLLVGSTINEFAPFAPAKKATMAEVKESLQKKYGDKTDEYIAAVKKAYPTKTKPFNFTDIDLNFRPLAIKQANMKAVKGAAPVYMYLFTWQSPVNGGIYEAMHCMDIAFEFANINRCEEMTGGGKDAYALSAKMSSAWVNFARTGNPNTPGLPIWPAYTEKTGATMLFDVQSRIANHPDAEILKAANIKL
jgi:para-nitrobenzyl esterase